MWLSSETNHAGSNSPITPTRNHPGAHLRQRRRPESWDILSSTSGQPGVGNNFSKGASLSYFFTIPSQHLILRICSVDRSIPSPDHQGSEAVCTDQKEKVVPYSKPQYDITWPQLCPIGLFGCFSISLSASLSTLLNITGILTWLLKLERFSVWLIPVKTSLLRCKTNGKRRAFTEGSLFGDFTSQDWTNILNDIQPRVYCEDV